MESTIKDFSIENGKKGVFQQYLKSMEKNNKCSNVDCNNMIIKTVISNRATFFVKMSKIIKLTEIIEPYIQS